MKLSLHTKYGAIKPYNNARKDKTMDNTRLRQGYDYAVNQLLEIGDLGYTSSDMVTTVEIAEAKAKKEYTRLVQWGVTHGREVLVGFSVGLIPECYELPANELAAFYYGQFKAYEMFIDTFTKGQTPKGFEEVFPDELEQSHAS